LVYKLLEIMKIHNFLHRWCWWCSEFKYTFWIWVWSNHTEFVAHLMV